MTKKTVTSLALAAGCAIALAMPAAQAQTRSSWGGNAALNNAESAHYDRLVESSPGFRQSRMRQECGPITDAQLRQNCMASFAEYEPQSGSRGRTMANSNTRWNRGTTTGTGDFYTGSSTAPGMTGYNSQSNYSGAGSDWG